MIKLYLYNKKKHLNKKQSKDIEPMHRTTKQQLYESTRNQILILNNIKFYLKQIKKKLSKKN